MVTRLFKLGIRFAAWITPHAKRWYRQRHLNRTEGERHLAAKNWGEAEKHFILALDERKHSPKLQIGMMLGLFEAQRKQGKTTEAEQTIKTAVDLAASAKDGALQSRALDALADLQLDQKRYSEAEQTIGQIEALERAALEPNFKRITASARKLGTALLHSGRMDEAMKSFERAARVAEKAYGPEHPETGNAYAELGAQYRLLGNHPEAQRCLRRALQIHRAIEEGYSPDATQDLIHLAASLEESGDVEGACAEFERVLSWKQREVGGDRGQTAEIQARLAAIYVQTGKSSQARELLTHAIGILEDEKKDDRLVFALETMAEVEEQIHRSEDAKKWRTWAAEVASRCPAPQE
jgi:tetratricopeptide (TPR) repeat protein